MQRLKAKEEELLKHFVAAKKEKKEIPWLKQWLAKEEERKRGTGDKGRTKVDKRFHGSSNGLLKKRDREGLETKVGGKGGFG